MSDVMTSDDEDTTMLDHSVEDELVIRKNLHADGDDSSDEDVQNSMQKLAIVTEEEPQLMHNFTKVAPVPTTVTSPSQQGRHKFCTECGSPIVPSFKFCGDCGNKLQ